MQTLSYAIYTVVQPPPISPSKRNSLILLSDILISVHLYIVTVCDPGMLFSCKWYWKKNRLVVRVG